MKIKSDSRTKTLKTGVVLDLSQRFEQWQNEAGRQKLIASECKWLRQSIANTIAMGNVDCIRYVIDEKNMTISADLLVIVTPEQYKSAISEISQNTDKGDEPYNYRLMFRCKEDIAEAYRRFTNEELIQMLIDTNIHPIGCTAKTQKNESGR